MSRARLGLLLVLSALSLLWASFVLFEQYVRVEQRGLLASIRAGKEAPAPKILDRAIARYQHALRLLPCNNALHADIGVLHAMRADLAMDAEDTARADATLEQLQHALAARLACTPMEGKTWLDFAHISIQREGFTQRARDAFQMSARVAPGESWLAEKRLRFALDFLPFLDTEMRSTITRDLAVLDNAHPNRIKALMATANAPSAEALAQQFSTHPTHQRPLDQPEITDTSEHREHAE